MKYESKEALLRDIRTEHDSLCARLREIPKVHWREKGVWGDGWTVSDLVAHVAEWQRMFLTWSDDGLKGTKPEMPAPGYRWSDTPRINRAIWEKHRSRSPASVMSDFESGYSRITQLVDALSPEQLLMPGQFEWTGKHPLTTYLGPNTASHYRFAIKAIKRWRKGVGEVGALVAGSNKRIQPTKARIGSAQKKASRPRRAVASRRPAREPDTSRLQLVLDRLEQAWGLPAPPPARAAFEHVLWENVGYLTDDERRARAYSALRNLTGLRPEGVLGATSPDLVAVCRLGGAHAGKRAARLQESARILLQHHSGDQRRLLRQPLGQAMRALMQFPAIGRPGAEKILLFTDTAPLLPLESNGLRTLLRLGYGKAGGSYDRDYRSAQAAAAPEVAEDFSMCRRAFLLLRELGRRTCRRTGPECSACPARALCPSRID